MTECESCLMANIHTPATTSRWIHQAWGNAACYDVPLCDDCAEEHDNMPEDLKEIRNRCNLCDS